MAEIESFGLHPDILLDIIKRQVGSLSRAVLEAVQNSVDAEATVCKIDVDEHTISISDDGRGIPDRAALEHCFKVFGQPHTESEAKQFGAFRMGRGQLFAFGRNVWRTHNFQMVVDIDKHLGYELEDNVSHVPGCSIVVSLKNALSETDITRLLSELRRDLAWLRLKVVVNGTGLSRPPEAVTWKHQTGWYYFHPNRTGQLNVFNLGLRVTSYTNSRFSIGGDMVSTVPLQLNFARNDVMETCPVWREFQSSLDAFRTQLESDEEGPSRKIVKEKPKRSRSSSSGPRRKVTYIPVHRRSRRLEEFCAQLAAFEDELRKQTPDLNDKAVTAQLVQKATELAADFTSFHWLRIACDRDEKEVWASYNALRNKVKGTQQNRVVFSHARDRTDTLARRSKLAVSVRKMRDFNDPKHLALFLRVANWSKFQGRQVELITDDHMEKLAREAVIVTTETELSGYEKAVLRALKAGFATFSCRVNLQEPEYCLGELGSERLQLSPRGTRLILDRSSLYGWVGSYRGWLETASMVCDALVRYQREQEEEDTKYTEEFCRETWWQLQRLIWEFAMNALRSMARAQVEGLEEAVVLAAAHECDKARYINEIGRRHDLALAAVKDLRGNVERLEAWLASTLNGQETVALGQVRMKRSLPADWDAGVPPLQPVTVDKQMGLAVRVPE
jgi:hypothetical protein